MTFLFRHEVKICFFIYLCAMIQRLLAVLGPTASGKTALAVALARKMNGEILSADSRQVYRGMDIGTGKDLDEYSSGGEPIACHLLDLVEAGEKYNLFRYQQDFFEAFRQVTERNKLPILCGGSGLYLEAVLRGYALSPVPQNERLRAELANKSLSELTDMLSELKEQSGTTLHNTTDVDSVQRAIRAIEIETYNLVHKLPPRVMPTFPATIIGVDVSREVRRERIAKRLTARLENGLVEEIKTLLGKGISPENLIYYGLEYKFVTEYVLGHYSLEEMKEKLTIAIQQFAKRQMTWFRGMERRGMVINWLSPDEILKLTDTDVWTLKSNEETANGEMKK